MPDREETGQGVETVGERRPSRSPARSGRRRSVPGRVVLGRWLRPPSTCSRSCCGIVAPHHALQFRKLADHAGHQVGLGRAAPRAPRTRPGCRARAGRARPQGSAGGRPWRRASRARRGTRRRPARAGGSRAAACGPGPRRTAHPRAGPAARARCRRRWLLPPSSAGMLATTRKRGASLPAEVLQRQVFLVLVASRSPAPRAVSAMNRCVDPARAARPATRPAPSSSSSSAGIAGAARRPSARASRAASPRDHAVCRSAPSSIDLGVRVSFCR